MEWELVNIFTYNLAMCELLSIHGHITIHLHFNVTSGTPLFKKVTLIIITTTILNGGMVESFH